MARGHAVTIAPIHQRLTTQEAAELLGVSRPKLLEAREIPFEQPGGHRRVHLADVLAYRHRVSAERWAALERMVEIADAADLCERAATLNRARRADVAFSVVLDTCVPLRCTTARPAAPAVGRHHR
jgi:excisionase family DNA binding protein